VQSAVVPVQVGADGKAVNGQYTAEVDASKAGLAMVTLRRAEDEVAMAAPVLLTVVGGPCAGLALVSATPALDKVRGAKRTAEERRADGLERGPPGGGLPPMERGQGTLCTT